MTAELKKLKQLIAQRQIEIIRIQDLEKIANQAVVNRDVHKNFNCRYKHIDTISDNFDRIQNAIINSVATLDNPNELEVPNKITTEFSDMYYQRKQSTRNSLNLRRLLKTPQIYL